MKKLIKSYANILAAAALAICVVLTLVGCADVTQTESTAQTETSAPESDDVVTIYFYVNAVGDGGFIASHDGSTYFVSCDTSNISMFQTIRVDVAAENIIDESGKAVVEQFGETKSITYTKLIKSATLVRKSDPSTGEPLFG